MRQLPRASLLVAGALLAAPLVLASCWGDEPTGESQQVSITLANHTSVPANITEEDGDCPSGLGIPQCVITPNGGWRIIRLSLRDGTVVNFRVYEAGGLKDEVDCKWRGETAIMVDYQVPQGSQTAQLLCVVWHEP